MIINLNFLLKNGNFFSRINDYKLNIYVFVLFCSFGGGGETRTL